MQKRRPTNPSMHLIQLKIQLLSTPQLRGAPAKEFYYTAFSPFAN